jgi:hypothetical protein
MNELQKLKLHLHNLQEAGHEEFNVNVKWLLDVIEHLPKEKQEQLSREMDLDGGKFNTERF